VGNVDVRPHQARRARCRCRRPCVRVASAHSDFPAAQHVRWSLHRGPMARGVNRCGRKRASTPPIHTTANGWNGRVGRQGPNTVSLKNAHFRNSSLEVGSAYRSLAGGAPRRKRHVYSHRGESVVEAPIHVVHSSSYASGGGGAAVVVASSPAARDLWQGL